MNKLRARIVALGLLCAGSTAHAGVRVYPSDNSTSIEFPVEPSKVVQMVGSPIGEVEVVTLQAKTDALWVAVSLSEVPYFAYAVTGAGPVLDSARGSLLKEFHAKRTSWKLFYRLGVKGHRLTYDIPSVDGEPKRRGMAELYFLNGRLAVLNVVAEASATDAEMAAFFNSIRRDG